ncbi:hypothetical protein A3735_14385 [Oleiphilus sp. HI0061]|uniref:hypothetical protein n=1 Tax=Oleiphilus sp. HI0061 TaxID=1822239 RepID=UPI0007CFD0C2|nr:hypothetical protein [Oleiphilus sp. HI0061]KZY59724.1 hypothetical protein A3735_14385 [Oleiphilus sp. HI0061]
MVGTIDYSTSPWTINSNNLSSSGGQDFTINLGTNEYGFFAYPAALGEAYFYDRDNMNILGAWDGASWTPYTPDFSELSQTGPIVTEIDGVKWFVYRTDYPELGEMNYAVRFDNPGMAINETIACDLSSYEVDANYRAIDPSPEPELGDGTCSVSNLPRHGTSASNVWTESAIKALSSELSSTENQRFTNNIVGADTFGFFASPVALGEVIFTEVALGFPGGWDGAASDVDDDAWFLNPEVKYSPIVVRADNTDWFVYRMDFPNSGELEFDIEFANAGADLNSTVACNSDSFPGISYGTVNGDTDLNIVSIYAIGDLSSPLTEGSVSSSAYEINATYLDDGTYDIYFATEASGGVLYGPQAIIVTNGEITNSSFDVSTWTSTSN